MHPRHKFHDHHPHMGHHHGGPSFRKLIGFALGAFVLITLFAHSGWWMIFFLPWLFYALKPLGLCAFGDDETAKRKNDDKPKRRVVETADGEFLEVIDEPRRV